MMEEEERVKSLTRKETKSKYVQRIQEKRQSPFFKFGVYVISFATQALFGRLALLWCPGRLWKQQWRHKQTTVTGFDTERRESSQRMLMEFFRGSFSSFEKKRYKKPLVLRQGLMTGLF
ncbi:unnamed protein product [Kuraishia capsulata CBS 1993]|uniref:Uncharacterized protein n=1 Tax=Kuraishia capsulata CBS 1993 TaxID=1382522 RepID=W6MTQ0_9ASCO|nr:uncharacterized protein KUCA_T00001142001 [Kuraishia capsulata CBS 1993]CDK25175.1 unnamed protein product [Kuraishia capsulata CBS 1993]